MTTDNKALSVDDRVRLSPAELKQLRRVWIDFLIIRRKEDGTETGAELGRHGFDLALAQKLRGLGLVYKVQESQRRWEGVVFWFDHYALTEAGRRAI